MRGVEGWGEGRRQSCRGVGATPGCQETSLPPGLACEQATLIATAGYELFQVPLSSSSPHSPAIHLNTATPEYISISDHQLQDCLVNSDSADFAETALFFPFYFGRAAHSLFRQTINLVANLPPEDESSETLQRTQPQGWQQGGGLLPGFFIGDSGGPL